MFRAILICAIACGLAAPAMAGDRKPPAPTLPISFDFLSRDGALTVDGDYVVRLSGASAPSVALADFESLMVPRFDIGIVRAAEPIALSLYAASNLPAPIAWRLTDEAPVMTMSGYNAVREAMIAPLKPGAIRRSALSAMLVLRIDGKTDSAPLSIGGSAAPLWAVLPR